MTVAELINALVQQNVPPDTQVVIVMDDMKYPDLRVKRVVQLGYTPTMPMVIWLEGSGGTWSPE